MIPASQSKPAKPLSAYGIFFRDTITEIKHQYPRCSYEELSAIVTSMWDTLDPVRKEVYQKKSELTKQIFLKELKTIEQHPVQLKTIALQTKGNGRLQPNAQHVDNNIVNNITPTSTTHGEESRAQADEQMSLLAEEESLQKCKRKNCTKDAIKSPDWDENCCSSECAIIYCCEEFNDWLRSSLEPSE